MFKSHKASGIAPLFVLCLYENSKDMGMPQGKMYFLLRVPVKNAFNKFFFCLN